MSDHALEGKFKSFYLWSAFSSIKLTLFLLILLAVVSIFGTLIPQQEGAMELAEKLSPGLVRFLSSVQIFDMYHSIWFRLIIGALAVNLVVCSLDRFPSSLRRFRSVPKADREKLFENLPPERRFPVKTRIDQAGEIVASVLKTKYKNLQKKDGSTGTFYFAEKGRYTYFGVYLVHLSVLLILVGGIIGSLFGFEGFASIPEGEGVDKVILRKSRTPKPLPFTVRCEKFTVEFYPNGAPKEYRSDLVFVRDGRIAFQGPLRVNHPITFEGITFYQSSYRPVAGDKVRIKLTRDDGNPEPSTLELTRGNAIELPGKEGRIQILEVSSDFRGLGPAALVSVHPHEGATKEFWIFQNFEMIRKRFPSAMLRSPSLDPSAFKPYTFSLEGVEMKYATGLQVSRDPGVPLVWSGFTSIVIGLFVTFFLFHRMIWVRLAAGKKGVTVAVAGMGNKNPVGMERELDTLVDQLGTKLQEPKSS